MLSPSVEMGLERELTIKDTEHVKSLGRGAFGEVSRVKVLSSGREYAMKQIRKADILKRNMQRHVANEVKIMYSLNHENIIKLHSHFEDELSCYQLIELAQNVGSVG